jgi:hypothetical protein
MSANPMSLAARLYALLLYLYPSSFRREYGESMLQLFNDQRRAVSGAGGNAMLWLKTLRDLVSSIPAAYLSERQTDGQRGAATVGAVFVWGLIGALACTFLAFAVVIPSTVGYLPPTDEAASIATAEQVAAGEPGPYRALVVAGIAVVATLLAGGAFLFSLAQRSLWNGAAVFVAGAMLSIFTLGSNPWIWMRQGEPSVAGLWILAVWPLAAIAWAALTIAKRRQSVDRA